MIFEMVMRIKTVKKIILARYELSQMQEEMQHSIKRQDSFGQLKL